MDVEAPKQADHKSQELLQSLVNNEKSEIKLSNGRTVKIGWLMPETQDKIDDLIVQHDTIAKKIENKEMSVHRGNHYTRQFYPKMAAAILINNHFGLKFFWWLKWRFIYKFWKINGDDYSRIIAEAKKKATEPQYLMAMAFSMTMADIWTTMTTKEAEVFHRELNSAKEQPQ